MLKTHTGQRKEICLLSPCRCSARAWYLSSKNAYITSALFLLSFWSKTWLVKFLIKVCDDQVFNASILNFIIVLNTALVKFLLSHRDLSNFLYLNEICRTIMNCRIEALKTHFGFWQLPFAASLEPMQPKQSNVHKMFLGWLFFQMYNLQFVPSIKTFKTLCLNSSYKKVQVLNSWWSFTRLHIHQLHHA